ncbi:MAG: hypothetical protein QME52_03270 [Bacteroidota bacterium]|nr:hypothetical protein [Bacteroidota bacterium]
MQHLYRSVMAATLYRKITKAMRNLPNLLQGYNIYVNRDKLHLINLTFKTISPEAESFADLGGVWKVNAAYTFHTLKNFTIKRGVLVDTDYPIRFYKKLKNYQNLQIIRGDFMEKSVVKAIGKVDVLYFFDVLLHQANPNWNEVLEVYSHVAQCFVIYNQQFIQGDETIRLTDLPLERYIELTSDYRKEFYKYVYEHRLDIHPEYHKPWIDIHNISQWGITDKNLRNVMTDLGYKEIYFYNHGRFLNLPAFENHAFVFKRDD